MEYTFIVQNHPVNYPVAKIHADNEADAVYIFENVCPERLFVGANIRVSYEDKARSTEYIKFYEVIGTMTYKKGELTPTKQLLYLERKRQW